MRLLGYLERGLADLSSGKEKGEGKVSRAETFAGAHIKGTKADRMLDASVAARVARGARRRETRAPRGVKSRGIRRTRPADREANTYVEYPLRRFVVAVVEELGRDVRRSRSARASPSNLCSWPPVGLFGASPPAPGVGGGSSGSETFWPIGR